MVQSVQHTIKVKFSSSIKYTSQFQESIPHDLQKLKDRFYGGYGSGG